MRRTIFGRFSLRHFVSPFTAEYGTQGLVMPGTYMPLNYIPSPCSLIEKGPGEERRQSCRTSVCRVAADGFAARAGDSKWKEVSPCSPQFQ